MDPIDRLTEYFTKFPGIGPRQARRFAYFLLQKDPRFRIDLSRAIEQIGDAVLQCRECFRYFPKDADISSFCRICRDTHREDSALLIVEKDVDVDRIEKSGAYHGKYFIIGGTIPILNKRSTTYIRIPELTKLIERKRGTLAEIILALSANSEGDHTAEHIMHMLRPTTEQHGIKLSLLGRGLSTGTEIEYSDAHTLKHAFENRK